jgi:N-terminal acetyltransferase B complex non-catalytic subunit
MIKGFTAVAVDQYNHVRVKEILNDTLSHNLLTRISQVHPFDSKAMKVYPDQELRNVVSTIDRMERKVDDFLYQDMQDVQYDQTFELLDFKRQLRSSLTKHLCIIERRRIARLKGEILDDPRPSPISEFKSFK